jgi:hypothetical protein
MFRRLRHPHSRIISTLRVFNLSVTTHICNKETVYCLWFRTCEILYKQWRQHYQLSPKGMRQSKEVPEIFHRHILQSQYPHNMSGCWQSRFLSAKVKDRKCVFLNLKSIVAEIGNDSAMSTAFRENWQIQSLDYLGTIKNLFLSYPSQDTIRRLLFN